MTAVDVDALDAARAVALREEIANWWSGTHTTTDRDRAVADDVIALPAARSLLAEARKYRALREVVIGLAEELDRVDELFSVADRLRAVAAGAETCEHEWMEFGGPGDEWRECYLCGKQEDR